MLSLFVTTALVSQTPPRVAVVDVSAPDAIYEDISRALAQRVSDALVAAGYTSRRVDESEMPVEHCRLGPCLGVIAKSQAADVLVLIDATEGKKGAVDVVLTAMRGRDGLPLAGGRWVTTSEGRKPKQLGTFIEALKRATTQAFPSPRAPSTRAPGAEEGSSSANSDAGAPAHRQ